MINHRTKQNKCYHLISELSRIPDHHNEQLHVTVCASLNPEIQLPLTTFLYRGGETALNPLSANPTKWSRTLKQFVGSLPTKCLSVFDHFVWLLLKGLIKQQ